MKLIYHIGMASFNFYILNEDKYAWLIGSIIEFNPNNYLHLPDYVTILEYQ